VKVLVDTSVWIAHFQRSDLRFQALLSDGSALIHSAVVGELACGNLTRRSRVLSDLRKLSAAAEADPEDTLFVIESRRLWGKGIGWTNAQLIASALLTGCSLWSHDKQLQKVAAGLGIAY
jgi:predicted nucleic acid-binding protein